jgi:hypothetical protein
MLVEDMGPEGRVEGVVGQELVPTPVTEEGEHGSKVA